MDIRTLWCKRSWWPCKQDLDKVEITDIYITAPIGFLNSVGNGLFTAI
jgi:hypothetical protein